MTAIRAAIQAAIRPAIYVATAGGGSTVWTPASLFSGSEVGVWYDPSDLSTMWQDTAGTVPITADGQAVARIDDKSGNGKHATQSSASSRPLYKTSGGLHWLQFDGADDSMIVAAPGVPILTDMFICCGALRAANAAGRIFSNLVGPSNYNNYEFGWNANSAGNIDGAWYQSNATSGTAYAPFANVITNNQTFVFSAKRATNVISFGKDGTFGPASGTLTTPVGSASAAFAMGMRADAYAAVNGRLYNSLILGRLPSAAEISAAHTYIGGKCGVTL